MLIMEYTNVDFLEIKMHMKKLRKFILNSKIIEESLDSNGPFLWRRINNC